MLESENKDVESEAKNQEIRPDSMDTDTNELQFVPLREAADQEALQEVAEHKDSEHTNDPLPQLDIESESVVLDQQNIPDLSLSRERTPDTDYYDDSASGYSELARGTPQPEESNKRLAGGPLDTDRAVKRTHSGSEHSRHESSEGPSNAHGYDPENPAGVRQEKIRRRVAAKVIDKFWTPLDAEGYQSLENLCDISLNKVLERYDGERNPQAKVEETQRVILNNWLSKRHPRSFLARLQVTKLPPLKSLQVRMRGVRPNSLDTLNIDLVLRQKKVSESYLLAELEQLKSLETYYKSLMTMYELDAKYLQDFKKSTSALQAEHAQEKQAKLAELHLEAPDLPSEDIALLNKPLPVLGKLFDPNTDSDVLLVLQELDKKISAANVPTKKLLDFCDQLDSIYSKLNSSNGKRHPH